MTAGTALFDTVAISGTEAKARAGLVRRCAVGAGVGGRGATADCNGRGCAGLCVGRRRRGAHGGWGRDVQGRQYREQHGGGACAQRMLHRRALRVASARAACCIGAHCIGAIHRLVCCINMSHRCVLHRCAFRVASVRIARCMFPRCVLHGCASRGASVRVACCIMHRRVVRVASARVGVLHVACCKHAAVPQRTVVQSVVWCLVRVRCPIGRRCCTM
jgi:hypothetical protein